MNPVVSAKTTAVEAYPVFPAWKTDPYMYVPRAVHGQRSASKNAFVHTLSYLAEYNKLASEWSNSSEEEEEEDVDDEEDKEGDDDKEDAEEPSHPSTSCPVQPQIIRRFTASSGMPSSTVTIPFTPSPIFYVDNGDPAEFDVLHGVCDPYNIYTPTIPTSEYSRSLWGDLMDTTSATNMEQYFALL